MSKVDKDRWYPIANVSELRDRHVGHTSLMGQEMALWRDDLGVLNAWENRCPHRGVRLSLGINMGSTLKCQYHGWTYQTGSGTCTYVPAHPSSFNPSNACVATFPVREMNGIVWSTLGHPTGAPEQLSDSGLSAINLRSLVFNVDGDVLEAALVEEAERFAVVLGGDVRAERLRPGSVRLSSASATAVLLLQVQPVAESKSATHALLVSQEPVPLQLRLDFARILAALRRLLEKKNGSAASSKTKRIAIRPIPVDVPPSTPKKMLSADFRCRVVARSQESVDVASFQLLPIDRPLPTLTPGMHIDVHTPSGIKRQYSIVNKPGELDGFVIGVKLESASRGGSKSMHEDVHVGSDLTVSIPRNGFPLRVTAKRPILVAGGIGITPILSMAQALAQGGRDYTAHYFVRGPDHTPFKRRLEALGHSLNLYNALDVQATVAKLGDLVNALDPATDEIYICGPLALIEAVSQLAEKRGFQDDNVRFELFANKDGAVDGVEFGLELARSGISFSIPAGKTVVKACAEHGVDIETSCEQGVCGTCIVPVISGDLDHHDAYLSKAERASGRWIMPCVSRAKSGILVLDI